MPDDLKKTGKQDDIRITLSQEHEVNYWSKELQVTPERLRELVGEVGSMVNDVKGKVSRSAC